MQQCNIWVPEFDTSLLDLLGCWMNSSVRLPGRQTVPEKLQNTSSLYPFKQHVEQPGCPVWSCGLSRSIQNGQSEFGTHAASAFSIVRILQLFALYLTHDVQAANQYSTPIFLQVFQQMLRKKSVFVHFF